ncbi:MAG: 2-oxoglutarate dehydrogenase E1 component [Verrucomicrobia bacterium]|nr:2-oxoglutarate dehydrogenase E1 component [Verrucomicrobiota bacterium]
MSTSFTARWNEAAIDDNYEKWRKDAASVSADWASFFEGFELGYARYQKAGTKPSPATSPSAPSGSSSGVSATLESRVEALIYTYRTLGHTASLLNPLSEEIPYQPLLEPKEFDLTEVDLDETVSSRSFRDGAPLKLRDIIAELKSIYCGTLGVEYMHIQNPHIRHWIRERVEARAWKVDATTSHFRILRTLHKAESFENFLHTTYVGSKRFSLEGGESMMVALSEILHRSPGQGIKEIILGMSHRGRLNVLTNFLKKPFAILFNEFSDKYDPDLGDASGDVKYHLGYQTTRRNEEGEEVEVYLAANPSHLEAVDPVVLGKVRARQRILDDIVERKKVIPVLIHGDAAFPGQGIVAECFNLSQLPGYKVGGTIHLIVNNQIGFTTLPADSRSTLYCTEIAKTVEAPVFHVNGDDPIAVAEAARIALAFRQEFGRDVVVDIVCYRRYGHNEGDEPLFTQPDLYKVIRSHKRPSEVFLKRAEELGTLTREEFDGSWKKSQSQLEAALAEMKKGIVTDVKANQKAFVGSTAVFQPHYSFTPVKTAISEKTLKSIVDGLTTVPSDFRLLPKIRKNILERRREVFEKGGPYDWAYGEALAFGSLMIQGIPIRLSGQDSRRGTFSNRHAVFYDEVNRERYIPLMHLAPDQARFCVYNSPLSEAAVLGFDYGYSMDYPDMLCMWEAQFGDFANGAQVIIDQFIAAGETKWLRPSSLVLLLQLCADENMEVCNFTTPAQYFHALRRQMLRDFRKPLIVMTPKSLLRSETAVSTTEDFTKGEFHEILEGPKPADPSKVERLILCTGKVYYDLQAYREKSEKGWSDRSALVRLEQIYPLNEEKLRKITAPYANAEEVIWCQEEPENMGGWHHLLPKLIKFFGRAISYAGRQPGASTAVGTTAAHKAEQASLISQAYGESV